MDERLGIAGSGTIATGLATAAAAHGEVVMWARSEASAERSRARIAKACDAESAARVHVTIDPGALASCSFLVEAVVEDPGAKASVLGELTTRANGGAVLATTTSSLSVTELARATGRPERFVGLHVFNPVPKMELVELAFPPEASDATRERARALCDQLGKTAIEVPDLPGFVVNRLLFPFLFRAVDLLEETGLEPADVDACLTLGAGHPMGPLKLLDFVGLDVALAIGESIGEPVPDAVRALVGEGALGRKSGRGFHSY